MWSAPWAVAGLRCPLASLGFVLGNEANGDFSLLGSLLGNCHSPSRGGNAAGSVVSPLIPILWDMGMTLDPSRSLLFSLLLQL